MWLRQESLILECKANTIRKQNNEYNDEWKLKPSILNYMGNHQSKSIYFNG